MEENTNNNRIIPDITNISKDIEKTQPEPILGVVEPIKDVVNTSNQVKKAPNPTGKGGFVDNPQNRSDGRWSKENSFSYWLNFFKAMKVTDFEVYKVNKPKEERCVAENLAFNRIVGASENLKEFQEVANRTEGKPMVSIDHTTGGEKLNNKIEWVIIDGEKDGTENE